MLSKHTAITIRVICTNYKIIINSICFCVFTYLENEHFDCKSDKIQCLHECVYEVFLEIELKTINVDLYNFQNGEKSSSGHRR